MFWIFKFSKKYSYYQIYFKKKAEIKFICLADKNILEEQQHYFS